MMKTVKNILFFQGVLQENKFRNQISIAMKKKIESFTADMFRNYKYTAEE